MNRCLTIVLVSVTAMLGLFGAQAPLQAKVPGPNGRIAFAREDPTICRGCPTTYAINPDGTHPQLLLRSAGLPHWSPNGSEITVLRDCNLFGGPCAATIVNPDTRAVRTLPNPNPTVYSLFACLAWSPDGTKLGCSVLSDTPGLTGIYTIRSSDGGGLTQVPLALACPGECIPSDFSPDGKRIVTGLLPKGQQQPELFTLRLNGTELRQITPNGTDVDLVDGEVHWSPNGNQILFGGQPDANHRSAIFVVNADGGGLHQVPIPGCGGALSDPRSIACFDPGWSPDGTKIVFARSSPMFGTQAIYTANAGGSGLSQVTTSSDLGVSGPDWGPHTLAA